MIHTDKKENKSNMNHSAKATTEKKRAGKTEETVELKHYRKAKRHIPQIQRSNVFKA